MIKPPRPATWKPARTTGEERGREGEGEGEERGKRRRKRKRYMKDT